jgi:FkbM family methyltransferase
LQKRARRVRTRRVRTRRVRNRTRVLKPKKRLIKRKRTRVTRKHRQPLLRTVAMPDSKALLYVNLGDKRGKWLVNSRGVTQAKITHLWKQAVKTFQPDIVVDVGVNYGEIIFSTTYQPSAEIVGIEANPLLRPYITKSLQTHPNMLQMNIVYALASDRDHMEKNFFIDKAWSGTSSAVTKRDPQAVEQHKVKTITIDSLFADRSLSDKRLLFKVDVEGYEEFVMKGMRKLMSECQSFIGSLEFSNGNLEKAGTDVNGFLNDLQQHGQVFVHHATNQLVLIKNLNLAKLQKYYRTNQIHTDLLLLSNNESIDRLGLRIIQEIE